MPTGPRGRGAWHGPSVSDMRVTTALLGLPPACSEGTSPQAWRGPWECGTWWPWAFFVLALPPQAGRHELSLIFCAR